MEIRLIFFVNEFPPGPGGIGAQAYHLTKYFHGRGIVVRVHTASRSLFPAAEFDRVQPFEVYRYQARSLSFLKYLSFLAFFLRHRKWPTYILFSGSSQLALIPIVRFLGGSRILAIIHGHELLMARGVMRRYLIRSLRLAHEIVAVSEFSKRRLSGYLPMQAIHVIPNGIQIEGVVCDGRKSFSRTRPVRLITVGSVTPRKGQHNVVRALPYIIERVGVVEYHLVGIPDDIQTILDLASQYGVVNSIRVHGLVSDSQRDALLRDSDVFFMLSENLPDGDVEGFGIAVLEANLLGLPAIGSLNTGVEQAIADGLSGVLVNATDNTAIAGSIERILANYEKFSSEAVRWAKEHDWRVIGQKYLEVIENAG